MLMRLAGGLWLVFCAALTALVILAATGAV
jgi:hypothetical protein